MYTIIETPIFQEKAAKLWDTEERLAFFAYLAAHPLEGAVIPAGGGLRKIRWQMAGRGKQGGVRVIYFNMLENGLIVCADIYSKTEKTNLTPKELQTLRGQK